MEFCHTPFMDALAKLPPSTVMLGGGRSKTLAGALYKRSVSLAVGLRARGFQPKDRIAVIVPPGESFLEIFFASAMLNGMLALIDPEMGRDNFESKLKQFAPRWLFIDSRLLFLRENRLARYLYTKLFSQAFFVSFDGVEQIISVGHSLPIGGKYTSLSKLYLKTSEEITFRDHHDAEFMVTYTSGTLAEPKGVAHSVGSLFNSLVKIKELLSNVSDVRIAAYLPHFMMFGICSGHPVFLYDRRKSAAWVIRFLERNRITTLFGPPSFYTPLIQYCLENKRKLPASLQLAILGSAPVHPGFLRSMYAVAGEQLKVTCLYGMTEHLIIATIDGRKKMNDPNPGDVVGAPVNDVHLSIADDGEVLVNSPQLFSRYLHMTSRETPHHTGDLGYLANGKLVLTGRKKDMIIRRDTNIYPAIYERTIKDIPGVAEAVMIGVYTADKHDEEVFLVVESDAYSESELLKILQAGQYSIDREALPDKIVFRKIPLSGRQNKVDRKKLKSELTR